MKLFLASQDLGDFAEILRTMVGEKHRAFVISNARDYYDNDRKITDSTKKTLVNLGEIGIEAERLDLRPYFGKKNELAKLIDEKNIGLIFSIGGSTICLATALRESGMDKIIRDGVMCDNLVYGGYSAGSMVAAHDLSLYQVETQEPPKRYCNPDISKEIYGIDPYMQGLGLISEYIIPHMERPDHAAASHARLVRIEQAGETPICLNDGDVFVINGNRKEIKKGNS